MMNRLQTGRIITFTDKMNSKNYRGLIEGHDAHHYVGMTHGVPRYRFRYKVRISAFRLCWVAPQWIKD